MLSKEVADANNEREFSRSLLGSKTKDAEKMINLLMRDLLDKMKCIIISINKFFWELKSWLRAI